jgi:hypothetical protein
MRDLGLEDDCVRLGHRGQALNSIRWCYSMSGIEYGRIHAWGAGPAKMASISHAECDVLLRLTAFLG